MSRNPTHFHAENHLAQSPTGPKQNEAGWMLLQRVTRDGATRRLMTTYVTVLPYRYKLNSHPVQYNMMCSVQTRGRRGPWSVDLMQAAGGWRSCAVGGPAGQSAASASSAPSSGDQRKGQIQIKVMNHPTCAFCCIYRRALSSAVLIDSSFQITLQKLTNDAAALKYRRAPAPAPPAPLLLLTAAAEHKRLTLKLRWKRKISEINWRNISQNIHVNLCTDRKKSRSFCWESTLVNTRRWSARQHWNATTLKVRVPSGLAMSVPGEIILHSVGQKI